MGPKVDAACRFVRATGKRAAIGDLADLSRIIAGDAGTTITPQASGHRVRRGALSRPGSSPGTSSRRRASPVTRACRAASLHRVARIT